MIPTASLLPDKPARRNRPMVELTCQGCGSPFFARKDQKRKPTSCSLACRSIVTKRVRGHLRPTADGYHHWTDDEDEVIRRAWAAGSSSATLATQFGVSQAAVSQRAAVLGVKHRRLQRTIAERFADYVLPEPNSGCFLWEGSTDRKGYGQLRVARNVLKYATHIALELEGRPVPDGMNACHHCDNPICVNPDHLFIGTQKDNTDDMLRKGRASRPPVAKPGQGMKEFCVRGHPLSGDNLYYPPGNSRYRACRECLRIRKAAQNAKLKLARAAAREARCLV